jgi:hypothetical protein
MKKCPNCQKEFPDTMRFCQSDGTPLVDVVEESQPEDPLKTTVVRQEDIASSIPSEDPFKTVMASSEIRDESGDLLQLPEEDFDPLKTMVAQPIVREEKPVFEEPKPEPPRFEEIKEEIKSESSPYNAFSQPSEPLPTPPKDYSNDPVVQPEPPKFNEPNLNPPSFGDMSSSKEEDDLPQTVMQNPWDANNAPKPVSSPFSKPSDAPGSSPFDAPKSSFDEPQTPYGNAPSSPFDQPQSSFDEPKESPFNQPQQTPYEQPQSSFEPPTPTFQEPSNQFGQSQFDQMNQGFSGNQPLQASEWTPPPSPDQSWQEQGVGANTPFQPPVAGGGQNQTLPIISLIFGILSVCCYIGPITGIIALITGFLGMKNANNDPAQYGGKGLAIAGMITGGIFFVLYTLLWLLYLVGVVSMISLGGAR